MGRPSIYSEELTDEILTRLCDGESLRSICASENMPAQGTVYRWITEKPDFRENYEAARRDQAELYASEIIEIADETPLGEHGIDGAAVQRNRLRVDARKWIASKLLPKKYGDKIQQEVSGPNGGPVAASVTIELIQTRNCNGRTEG